VRKVLTLLTLLVGLLQLPVHTQLLTLGAGGPVGGGGGGSPIAFIQDDYGATGGSTVQTVDVAMGSNTTSGSLIVVITRTAADDLTSVTDTQGNTYTEHQDNTAAAPMVALASTVTTTSAANTVTCTWATSVDNYRWCAVLEYSPGSGTWSTTAATRYDSGSGHNTGNGTTSLTSTSFSTASAGIVIFGASQSALESYLTPSTNFTMRNGEIGTGGQFYGAVQDYITSGALSSYTITLTSSVTQEFHTIWGAFKTS
jgi:hypothetical protein